MSGKQDFEGLEQCWGFTCTFQHLLDLLFVPIGHGRDNGFLIFEVAVDQTDANAGFSTNVVHTSLVETVFGETDDGGVEDLTSAIEGGLNLRVWHGAVR